MGTQLHRGGAFACQLVDPDQDWSPPAENEVYIGRH
jgi:hypothetical protein